MDFRDDDELVPEGELDVRTAALQATVAFVVVRPCADCGAALCGHGAVLAVVLGPPFRAVLSLVGAVSGVDFR